MRAAGDAEDLAGGELPVLLVGAVAGALLELGELAPPGGEVLLLGHLPGLAQALEEVAQARAAGEPDGVDPDEVGQGRVEEPEPAVLVEDGEADGEVREGLGQGLDEAAERGLGGDEVVGVEREAHGVAGGARGFGELVPARLGVVAPGYRDPAPAAGAARGEGYLLHHLGEGVGDAVVGELARRRVETVAVGGVGPDHLTIGRAAPGHHRRVVEHVAQEAELGPGAGERGLGVGQRARLLGRRADREPGGAAARLADDLVGGAVAARAVVAEARAVEDERLEVGPQRGAVGGVVRRERREARPRRAGGPARRARAGSVSALRLAPVDEEVVMCELSAGGRRMPRGAREPRAEDSP